MPGSNHTFVGRHVFGELYGVDQNKLNDLKLCEKILLKGISFSKATFCGLKKKKFKPQGITIIALLSESHASIHTYPENRSLFIDAFTCGTECEPDKIINTIIDELKPTKTSIREITRGLE